MTRRKLLLLASKEHKFCLSRLPRELHARRMLPSAGVSSLFHTTRIILLKSQQQHASATSSSLSTDNRYDLAVVGGGIVGIASALEIAQKYPHLRLIVLEKERDLAMHQTGRNSGVIHAGLYYKPKSLKAQFCVAGSKLMYEFCDAQNVPYKKCGKLVVAVDQEEVPRLHKLYENAIQNGIPGLEIISQEKLRQIEPHCAGVAAINSPHTGIVDYKRVTHAMADLLCNKFNGKIECDYKVTSVNASPESAGEYKLTLGPASENKEKVPVECKAVIFCAGLQADRCAKLTGSPVDPVIVPFRGDYLELKDSKRHLVRGNIYPVPDSRYPFLGVHFTPRMDGKLWLGPTAVLAFKREGYELTDFNLRDFRDAIGFAGFWKMATKFATFGMREMYRAFAIGAQVKALQRYIPELRKEDVVRGPAGVRTQAMDHDGNLVEDFVIDFGSDDKETCVMHVRNAPSPAATSSLAIAQYIRENAEKKFTILRPKN